MRPINKVAIIHDWLTGMRGGEHVLEAIIDCFPGADIFTLFHHQGSVSEKISSRVKKTSWLQKIPNVFKFYRKLLPVFPFSIERFDLSEYDLIISSSHCVAKGIRKPKDAIHISYVHAPMRYMWDRFDDYFSPKRSPWYVRIAAHLFRPYLQSWDRKSSQEENVDLLIGNSKFIKNQIKASYGREASVIYPFANLKRFERARDPRSFYLMVGAFAPNKRVDLAIEAFNEIGLTLKVVGRGQEEQYLKSISKENIEFLGALTDAEINILYSQCKAFIFPGVEDFGITLVEVLAAGSPVIAYQEGGALEIVTDLTGMFFKEPTAVSLKEAVLRFESNPNQFFEGACRDRARDFSRSRFTDQFMLEVNKVLSSR